MLSRCLLIVCLLLTACEHSKPLLVPSTKPSLDQSLAQPCRPITLPAAADFDVWLDWVISDVLRAYGECASRHKAVVEAWPK